MHLVVKYHMDAFAERFDLDLEESKKFECFINYIIFQQFSSDTIDPNDLIYEGDDPGIDGIMFFIGDSCASSVEEVKEILIPRRRDYEVEVVFVQSKISESWDKKEINAFESAVLDFLSPSSSYPHSEFLKEKKNIFNELIKNVSLIKDGRPRVSLYFACTAKKIQNQEREIAAAFRAIEANVTEKGFFSEISVEPLNQDSIVDLWVKSLGVSSATFTAVGSAAFPSTPGVNASYVVTLRAKDFISAVLSDQPGKMRQGIYEKNVRDFMGVDNEVNGEILTTLNDKTKQKRFGMLNNGVTIISPEVKVVGTSISLKNFQIVNGCQTSSVLWEARDNIGDEVSLMLKLIETSDESVVDDIVRSTNRQTKVEDQQFLATLEVVKSIERYFNARGSTEEFGLLFERRTNQFVGKDTKAMRVFGIERVARCVGAMFFDRPDLSSRYPNKLTGELRGLVFKSENVEEMYYTAAFAYYRLQLLLSNKAIDKAYFKLRWHIMMAIKIFLSEGSIPQPGSLKMKKLCSKIDDFMKNNEKSVPVLKRLCKALADPSSVDLDELRRTQFVQDLKRKAQRFKLPAHDTGKPRSRRSGTAKKTAKKGG